MWTLTKRFTFEAAHRLAYHDGKCARLHGHSWVGYIECCGVELFERGSKTGMLIDYGDMSAALEPIVDGQLDHHYLNETLNLESPTSEVIAQWLYNALKTKLPLLSAVTIEETCTSRCEYRP